MTLRVGKSLLWTGRAGRMLYLPDWPHGKETCDVIKKRNDKKGRGGTCSQPQAKYSSVSAATESAIPRFNYLATTDIAKPPDRKPTTSATDPLSSETNGCLL